MKAKIASRLVVFAVAGTLLAGCQTQQQTNTAAGTGIGAATGAALGAIFGGGKGAAIGAGVGGLVGGVTGYNWQKIHNKLAGDTKGTGTQITEQPDGSLKVNIPSSVSFDTNSYAIKPSFATVLDQVAQTLNQNPEVKARVVGYTDSTGSAALNQTLSENRAESVVNYLIGQGVASNRLAAQGLGASDPIGDNNTEQGRAANRRVEMNLVAMGQHAQ
jgi:outer membrane protein OmpA-like peptidoglycan-associated protein